MNKVNTMKFVLDIIQGGRRYGSDGPVGKTYKEYLQNQSLGKLIDIAKNKKIKYYKNHNGHKVILKRETLIKKLS